MLKEFKEFIQRGNVIDLAVAFIMGGAFGAIVSSLVKDIVMPIVGVLLGGVDFTNLFITLKGGPYASLADAQKAGAATINYGVFINTIITFLIVAFAAFLLIKAMKATKKKPAAPAAPTTKECSYCLSTIPLKATRCPNCTSELKS
ncbi:MAG TPA: large conductance mechanosensitive channel protein MscL [Anaerolineae bacterium]